MSGPKLFGGEAVVAVARGGRSSCAFLPAVAALILMGAAWPLASSPVGLLLEQSVAGVVLDDSTGVPLGTAQVSLLGEAFDTIQVTHSDSLGKFTIRLRTAGWYRLAVRRLGYAPVTSGTFGVKRDRIVVVELRMSRRPLMLPALTVLGSRMTNSAFLDGFESRRNSNITGKYFTAADIQQKAHMSVVDLIRQVAGGQLTRTGAGAIRVSFARNMAQAAASPNGCNPVFFLDGIRVLSELEQARTYRWRTDTLGNDLDDYTNVPAVLAAMSPDEVYGVEIYAGASQVPAEFNERASCGAMIVWTKRGRGGTGLEPPPA